MVNFVGKDRVKSYILGLMNIVSILKCLIKTYTHEIYLAPDILFSFFFSPWIKWGFLFDCAFHDHELLPFYVDKLAIEGNENNVSGMNHTKMALMY